MTEPTLRDELDKMHLLGFATEEQKRMLIDLITARETAAYERGIQMARGAAIAAFDKTDFPAWGGAG